MFSRFLSSWSSSNSRLKSEELKGSRFPKVNDSLYSFYQPTGDPSFQILFFPDLQYGDSSEIHWKTWVNEDGTCMQKWLAQDFPGAGTFFVSYEDPFGDMEFIAENLTNNLVRGKIGQTPNCPVLMIGHGFGGLVIKQICCYLSSSAGIYTGEREERLRSLLNNIKAIAYYDTPHRGSRVLYEAVARTKDKAFLPYFDAINKERMRLNDKFSSLRKKYKWWIRGLGAGSQTISGPFKNVVVVKEESARQDADSFRLVEADHFGICKPTNRSSMSFIALEELVADVAASNMENLRPQELRESSLAQALQELPDFPPLDGIQEQLETSEAHGPQELPDFAPLESRAQEQLLAIAGTGGAGRNTMARQLLNNITRAHEYTCFVDDVKGNVKGIHILGDKLLREDVASMEDLVREVADRGEDGYFVSSQWLFSLEDTRRESLLLAFRRAGYSETYQTKFTTLFESIKNDHHNRPTFTDVSSTHSAEQVGEPERGVWTGKADSISNENSVTGSVAAENTTRRSGNEVNDPTCPNRRLEVVCIPPSPASTTSPSLLSTTYHHTKWQFGSSIVTLPSISQSRTVSTNIEKSFSMIQGEKYPDGWRDVKVGLIASAATTLNCCVRVHNRKVRIKFATIRGAVQSEALGDPRCNGLVLLALRANVYACFKFAGSDEGSEQISLYLDDECHRHQGRRFLKNGLEWLGITGLNPRHDEPGSTTLELRGDMGRGSETDLSRPAHLLHFQELPPFVLVGDIPTELNPKLFLELNIRYQLEIWYNKPCTPLPKESPFVRCRETTEVLDFDCCLKFTTTLSPDDTS